MSSTPSSINSPLSLGIRVPDHTATDPEMEIESDRPLAPEGVSAPRPRVPDESETDSRGVVQGRSLLSLGQSDTFHVRDGSPGLRSSGQTPSCIDRRRSSGHFEGERMGTAFPLLSYGENAYILLKMHFAVQEDVFLTLKYGKTRWRPGPAPNSAGGAYDAPPDPLVGWGGDTPPQTSTRSAPSLRFSRLGARYSARILAFPLLLIYEMTTGTKFSVPD